MIDSTVTKKILEKVAKIKDQLFVIKLSEIIISNKNLLTNFAYNISLLSDNGIRLIIVFEYENIVNTRLQEIAGSKEVDYSCFGQERLSELAEMIISGSINSYIVSQLCSYSVQTVGLSGKDNNTLIAKKPSATAPSYIGEAILVNPELLLINDSNNFVSVISPVAINEQGKTVIMNADSVCAMISESMGADYLIMLDESNYLTTNYTVLTNQNDLDNVIKTYNLRATEFTSSKLKAIKYALKNSECTILFLDSNIKDVLLKKLFDLTS